MSAVAPHLHPISIVPEDIDFMGHVNNARYLGWVQDAVLGHWNAFAPAEAVATRLWVALKHEITYRKPAFLDDEVIARTVLESTKGARAFYRPLLLPSRLNTGTRAIRYAWRSSRQRRREWRWK